MFRNLEKKLKTTFLFITSQQPILNLKSTIFSCVLFPRGRSCFDLIKKRQTKYGYNQLFTKKANLQPFKEIITLKNPINN
jgi:hypothetical protein